ncbi:hypothetical protein ACFL35_00890 [Candidatus Riflebacteria bacterium]
MRKILKPLLLILFLSLVFTPPTAQAGWFTDLAKGAWDYTGGAVLKGLGIALKSVVQLFTGKPWEYNKNFPKWRVVPTTMTEDAPLKIIVEVDADEPCYSMMGSEERGGQNLRGSLYTGYQLYHCPPAGDDEDAVKAGFEKLKPKWSIPDISQKLDGDWGEQLYRTYKTFWDIFKDVEEEAAAESGAPASTPGKWVTCSKEKHDEVAGLDPGKARFSEVKDEDGNVTETIYEIYVPDEEAKEKEESDEEKKIKEMANTKEYKKAMGAVKDGYFVYNAKFYLMKKKEGWFSKKYKTHKGKEILFNDIIKPTPEVLVNMDEDASVEKEKITDKPNFDANQGEAAKDALDKKIDVGKIENGIQMFKAKDEQTGKVRNWIRLLWMKDVPLFPEPYRPEFGFAAKPVLLGYQGQVEFVDDVSYWNPTKWFGLSSTGDTRNAHFPIVQLEDTTPPMTYKQGMGDKKEDAKLGEIQDEKNFVDKNEHFQWGIDGIARKGNPEDKLAKRFCPVYELTGKDGTKNKIDILNTIKTTKASADKVGQNLIKSVDSSGKVTYESGAIPNLINWAGTMTTHGANPSRLSTRVNELLMDHGNWVEQTAVAADGGAVSTDKSGQGQLVVSWQNVWDNMMYPYNGGLPSITKFGLVIEEHWNPDTSAHGWEKIAVMEAIMKEGAKQEGKSSVLKNPKELATKDFIEGKEKDLNVFGTTDLQTYEKVYHTSGANKGLVKRIDTPTAEQKKLGLKKGDPIIKEGAPRRWIKCTDLVKEASKKAVTPIKNTNSNVILSLPTDRTGAVVLYWYAEDNALPFPNVWTSSKQAFLLVDDIPPMVSISMANARDIMTPDPMAESKHVLPWYNVHSGSISNHDAGLIHDTATPHGYSAQTHRLKDNKKGGQFLRVPVKQMDLNTGEMTDKYEGPEQIDAKLPTPKLDGDVADNAFFVGRANEAILLSYQFFENCGLPRNGKEGDKNNANPAKTAMRITVVPTKTGGVQDNSFGFRFPIFSEDYRYGVGPAILMKAAAKVVPRDPKTGTPQLEKLKREPLAVALASEGGDAIVQGNYVIHRDGYFNEIDITAYGPNRFKSTYSNPMELIFTKPGTYKMMVKSRDGKTYDEKNADKYPYDDPDANITDFEIYFLIHPTTIQVHSLDERMTTPNKTAKKN